MEGSPFDASKRNPAANNAEKKIHQVTEINGVMVNTEGMSAEEIRELIQESHN